MMRQEGEEKESKDPLSIPRAASHKEQKLVKLAKDRKATRNPCRGWGWPCLWPAHHSHTFTQETRLLSHGPQACPTGMRELGGELEHHASDSIYSKKPLIHTPTLLPIPQDPQQAARSAHLLPLRLLGTASSLFSFTRGRSLACGTL